MATQLDELFQSTIGGVTVNKKTPIDELYESAITESHTPEPVTPERDVFKEGIKEFDASSLVSSVIRGQRNPNQPEAAPVFDETYQPQREPLASDPTSIERPIEDTNKIGLGESLSRYYGSGKPGRNIPGWAQDTPIMGAALLGLTPAAPLAIPAMVGGMVWRRGAAVDENMRIQQAATRLLKGDSSYQKPAGVPGPITGAIGPDGKFTPSSPIIGADSWVPQKEEDQKLVVDWVKWAKEETDRGTTVPAQIQQGLSLMAPWMAEFAATGGLVKLGDKMGESAVKWALGRFATPGLQKAAGLVTAAGTQGGIGFAPMTAETMSRRQAEVATGQRPAEGWATSTMMAVGDSIIQAGSERTGEYITGGLSYAFKKIPGGSRILKGLESQWTKMTGGTASAFAEKMATATGYSSIIGEIGEEGVADALTAAFGIENFGQGEDATVGQRLGAAMGQFIRNIPVMAATFAVPGMAKGALNWAYPDQATIESDRKAAYDKAVERVIPTQAKPTPAPQPAQVPPTAPTAAADSQTTPAPAQATPPAETPADTPASPPVDTQKQIDQYRSEAKAAMDPDLFQVWEFKYDQSLERGYNPDEAYKAASDAAEERANEPKPTQGTLFDNAPKSNLDTLFDQTATETVTPPAKEPGTLFVPAPKEEVEVIPPKPNVFFDKDVNAFTASVFDEKLGNMHGKGETEEAATADLERNISEARKNGTWRSTEHPQPKGAPDGQEVQAQTEAPVESDEFDAGSIGQHVSEEPIKPGTRATVLGKVRKEIREHPLYKDRAGEGGEIAWQDWLLSHVGRISYRGKMPGELTDALELPEEERAIRKLAESYFVPIEKRGDIVRRQGMGMDEVAEMMNSSIYHMNWSEGDIPGKIVEALRWTQNRTGKKVTKVTEYIYDADGKIERNKRTGEPRTRLKSYVTEPNLNPAVLAELRNTDPHLDYLIRLEEKLADGNFDTIGDVDRWTIDELGRMGATPSDYVEDLLSYQNISEAKLEKIKDPVKRKDALKRAAIVKVKRQKQKERDELFAKDLRDAGYAGVTVELYEAAEDMKDLLPIKPDDDIPFDSRAGKIVGVYLKRDGKPVVAFFDGSDKYTAAHEFYHYAEDHLPDKKKRFLVKELGADPEARAEKWVGWRFRDEKPKNGLIKSIFEEISNFFRKMSNLLHGWGYRTWEDAFEDISTGKANLNREGVRTSPQYSVQSMSQEEANNFSSDMFKDKKGRAFPLWHYQRTDEDFDAFKIPAWFSKNKDYAQRNFQMFGQLQEPERLKPYYIHGNRILPISVYDITLNPWRGSIWMEKYPDLKGLLNPDETYVFEGGKTSTGVLQVPGVVDALAKKYDMIWGKEVGYSTYAVLRPENIRLAKQQGPQYETRESRPSEAKLIANNKQVEMTPYDPEGFLLTNGKAISIEGTTHEHFAKESGVSLSDLFDEGVVRYKAHLGWNGGSIGIEAASPMTYEQQKSIANFIRMASEQEMDSGASVDTFFDLPWEGIRKGKKVGSRYYPNSIDPDKIVRDMQTLLGGDAKYSKRSSEPSEEEIFAAMNEIEASIQSKKRVRAKARIPKSADDQARKTTPLFGKEVMSPTEVAVAGGHTPRTGNIPMPADTGTPPLDPDWTPTLESGAPGTPIPPRGPVTKQSRDRDWYNENRHPDPIPLTKKLGRKYEDFLLGFNKIMTPISYRIEKQSPEMFRMTRGYIQNRMMWTTQLLERVVPYLKLTRQLNPNDKADLNMALMMGDTKKIAELNAKIPGATQAHADVREVFNELYQRATELGIEMNYQEEFWARVIKDQKGLMREFGMADRDVIKDALNDVEDQRRRVLSEEEQGQVLTTLVFTGKIGKYLSRSTDPTKGRRLEVLPGNLIRHYHDYGTGLMLYIEQMVDKLSKREFFNRVDPTMNDLLRKKSATTTKLARLRSIKPKDKAAVVDVNKYNTRLIGLVKTLSEVNEKIRQNATADPKDLLGMWFANLKIDEVQSRDLVEAVSALFVTKQASPLIKGFMNLTYVDTLASPVRALSQLQDLGISYYRSKYYAGIAFIKVLAGKDQGALRATIAKQIGSEYQTENLWSATRQVLGLAGQGVMDRIGKRTLVETVLLKYQHEARKKKQSPDFWNRVARHVGPQDVAQAVQDFKSGEITDLVRTVMFGELCDVQPMSMLERPEWYIRHPNGRIFYMLRGVTLRQLNFAVKEAHELAKEGGFANHLKAFSRLLGLAFWVVLFGGTVGMIKAIFRGQEIKDVSPYFVDGLLQYLLIFNRYTPQRLQDEGVSGIAADAIVPPFQFWDAVVRDLYEDDPEKRGEITKAVPVFGDMYYWWMGAGARKQERKKNNGTF